MQIEIQVLYFAHNKQHPLVSESQELPLKKTGINTTVSYSKLANTESLKSEVG